MQTTICDMYLKPVYSCACRSVSQSSSGAKLLLMIWLRSRCIHRLEPLSVETSPQATHAEAAALEMH